MRRRIAIVLVTLWLLWLGYPIVSYEDPFEQQGILFAPGPRPVTTPPEHPLHRAH